MSNLEYYIHEGLPGIYGQRIFIQNNTDQYIQAKNVLDRIALWGGHDKAYTVDNPNDYDAVWWHGWEFPSNPERAMRPLSEARAALEKLGYKETKVCPY